MISKFKEWVPDNKVRIALLVGIVVISILLIIYILVPFVTNTAYEALTPGFDWFLGLIAPAVGLSGVIGLISEAKSTIETTINENAGEVKDLVSEKIKEEIKEE